MLYTKIYLKYNNSNNVMRHNLQADDLVMFTLDKYYVSK